MSKAYISRELRERVSVAARRRCGYCLAAEEIVGSTMEIDHLIPESQGGPTEEENLWLACPDCNGFKSDRMFAIDSLTGESIRLFDPRRQRRHEHFRWIDGGARVIGITPAGRATVVALQLNRTVLVKARQLWVAAGWHPPED